jgi:hypothetical protein
MSAGASKRPSRVAPVSRERRSKASLLGAKTVAWSASSLRVAVESLKEEIRIER